MSDFIDVMRKHQIQWRKKNLSHIKENGKQNGKVYEHILPWANHMQNFYPGIRESLGRYVEDKKIHMHTGIHNLMSSWVLCANLYWPFNNNEGFNLLSRYLSDASGIDINKIQDLELEYAEEGEFDPQHLLGEDSGVRGSGQTSPDLAIKFLTEDNKKGIFLIESKFTEHSFYVCSGYNKTKGGKLPPDPAKCKNTRGILDSDFQNCRLVAWKRKYWNLLKGDLNQEKFKTSRCPMSVSCYQLFRQQALAKGLEKRYDISVSCVTVDSRNEELINSSNKVGLKSFPEGWKELFPKVSFLWLNHRDWFEFVKLHSDGAWEDWLKYIGERYFLVTKLIKVSKGCRWSL